MIQTKKNCVILEVCLQCVWTPYDLRKEQRALLAISQHVELIQHQGITNAHCVTAQKSAILIYFVAEAWNHASFDLSNTIIADVLQLTSTRVENKVCLLQSRPVLPETLEYYKVKIFMKVTFFNLLKPTSNVMDQEVYIHELKFYHTVCVFCICLRTNSDFGPI
jgi:hypothetical protein